MAAAAAFTRDASSEPSGATPEAPVITGADGELSHRPRARTYPYRALCAVSYAPRCRKCNTAFVYHWHPKHGYDERPCPKCRDKLLPPLRLEQAVKAAAVRAEAAKVRKPSHEEEPPTVRGADGEHSTLATCPYVIDPRPIYADRDTLRQEMQQCVCVHLASDAWLRSYTVSNMPRCTAATEAPAVRSEGLQKRAPYTVQAVKTATICGGVCLVICVAVALGVLIPWKIDSDHCAEDATTTEEEDACIANLALIPATIAAVGAILCVMIAFGVCAFINAKCIESTIMSRHCMHLARG